jgi:ribonuclease HI
VKGQGKGHPLVLHVDGAARGNPGRAGAGVSITDGEGKKIVEMARYLGRKTNNQAEYLALLLGLKEAKRLGGESVRIFTDSELIERQIRGIYRVKDPKLRVLHKTVARNLAGFSSFQIESIPREQNHVADRLANQAIDERIATEIGKEGTQGGTDGRSP